MTRASRLVCMALLAGAAGATTMDDLQRDCGHIRTAFGFKAITSCATDLFTARPIHIAVGSTVPGGGTGIGARYTYVFNKGLWQRQWQTTAIGSLRNFWVADSTVTLTRPKFGDANTARDEFGIKAYVRARHLPLMPYYGIGPDTSLANLVDYRMNDTVAGATVSNPLAAWMAVGGTLESIWTDLGRVNDPKRQSIETKFSDASAPGLVNQPNLLHYEVFARPHFPAITPYFFDYKIGYNWYQDHNGGNFSFRRLQVDLRHNIYPERSFGQVKRDSLLSIRGYLSASYTGTGKRVPFYMQETLGGSDINNQPTLRGFHDYRFRGPNLMMVQVEYSRRIWGPIGLLGFYDTGKVTTQRSDLNFGNLRHSFGFGVPVYIGGKIVFRAYVGLGSGEGVHTFFGAANLL